ncbi:hypothetical protein SEA_KING2_49 [Arthrobacter phage King2]|uniref:Uncharacterized protein n=1 Tax=Arthrobacter phage King2 TaxID=2762386 RepID=A0A7G8LQU7_9CAUD|nr:hypothetical protein SEA_KING2_49 [Arthrobacter phage King2]
MKIIEQSHRTVTRHFLKIKIAGVESVPAGPDYVNGTRYSPERIEATWNDGDEPNSVLVVGTIIGTRHQIRNGHMLSRLPIELEFVRKLVADGIAL